MTVSPTTLALTELGASSTIEKTYTVVLDTDPGVNVTVTATNGDATAVEVAVEVDTDAGTTGNQSTLTFTHGNSGNWNTAQTVTVRALNDADAAAESFNITHAASAASGPYSGITIDPVAVTITDAGHGVVVSESSLSVAENDQTATYTVVLKSAPGGTVTIMPTSGATARATVSPGTLSFTNSDWNTPKTFTVTGKGAGTTAISHAVSAGTTAYPTSLTIPAVSVTVTADSRQVLDLSFAGSNRRLEGSVHTLTVTATGGSGTVVMTGGTALLTFSGAGIAAGDYTIVRAPGSSLNRGVTLDTSTPHSAAQPAVVFTGHGTNTVQVATLRVTAVHDSTDEGLSEALAVGFGSGNRAVRSNLDRVSGTGTTGTTTAGTATVTITDDDSTAVPEVSMELQTGESSNRNTAGQLELGEAGGVDGAVFNLRA